MKFNNVNHSILIRSLAVLLGLLIYSVAAAPVQAANDAETVARNFLIYLQSDKVILASEDIEQSLLDPALAPVTVAHLFHLRDGGYLLVATDRSVSPVKAYSLGSDFSALPEGYRRDLLTELELRVRVAATSGTATTARQMLTAGPTETETQWDFLLNYNAAQMPRAAYLAGTPLLSTKWNQDYPFNKFLPAVNGKTVLAGCVPVAMAQVMNYWQYPATTQGMFSYAWDGPPSQILQTILYRSYDWNNMPNSISTATPGYQVDVVALLLKDLGIVNKTAYSPTDSGASFNANALVETFGYSTALAQSTNDDYSTFISTIRGEIDADRPVIMNFPSHEVVLDGYSADNSGQKIHINMGWGGSANNFYFLNETVQANNYNFPTNAGALNIYYNIKPCSSSDCAVTPEPSDVITGLTITGTFSRNADSDTYEAYLKGNTAIKVSRPYRDIASYISIISETDGSTSFTASRNELADTTIDVGNLPAGKYKVNVSLCGAVECVTFDAAYNNYTVTLTTDSLTDAEKAAIDQALQKPPVMSTVFPDLVLNATGPAYKVLVDARDANGDAVTSQASSSNPSAVTAALSGNILTITPTGAAKVSSRISVSALANGQPTTKTFVVMTNNTTVPFGKTFTVDGTFLNQGDVQTRQVILDDACTITGTTPGYSNPTFFTSVLDASGQGIITATDKPINGTFTRGIYQLRVSYYSSGSSYYPYTQGSNDNYSLAVSCPNANDSISIIGALLGISPPPNPVLVGDINDDASVDLKDAILALQSLSGMNPKGIRPDYASSGADVNNNGRVGLPEVLYILQKAAGVR